MTNMNNKKFFKIKLYKAYCKLYLQVLYTHENLRNKGVIFEYNGFEIRSYDIPNLISDAICLRGQSKQYDHDIVEKRFVSNDERDQYLEKIQITVQEYKKFKERILSSFK